MLLFMLKMFFFISIQFFLPRR